MNPTNKHHLAAEVVARPGQKALVKQQGGEFAPAELLVMKTFDDLRKSDRFVQQVGAELAEEGVAIVEVIESGPGGPAEIVDQA